MSQRRQFEFLPRLDTGYETHREALLLATGLVIGLAFLTPLLSLISGVPAFIFVLLVGSVYGIVILLLRQLLVGALVGLIVTSPFAANVPLASQTYLETLPGHLGPEIWLVQIPLVLSVLLVLLTAQRKLLTGATPAEGFFAAFVGWTVLAAIFGATVRFDTALYFSSLMAQALIVFVVLRYVVQQQILSIQTVLQVFVGTVLAQSIVAVVQFFNGTSFGITTLGEGGSHSISTLFLGPLGTYSTGAFVSGFTGMSFILASLVILTVPVIAIFATQKRKMKQALLVGAALVMTGVLRASGSDAARGGLIISILLLGMLCFYSTAILDKSPPRAAKARELIDRGLKQSGSILATALAAVPITLYPSSTSGTASTITTIDGGTTTTSNPSAGTAASQSTEKQAYIEKVIENLAIPYFDLANLGVRVQQYIGGLDLMLRYPLFGIGGGNFVYYSTEYGLSEQYSIHNIYISLLATTGIPGFLFYSIVIGLILWCGWKMAVGSGENNALCIGVLCGMVGYLAFGFWDFMQLMKIPSLIPFWILAGAVVGEAHRTESESQSTVSKIEI